MNSVTALFHLICSQKFSNDFWRLPLARIAEFFVTKPPHSFLAIGKPVRRKSGDRDVYFEDHARLANLGRWAPKFDS